MADKSYKAFIVEGEAREPLIIDNISKVFFTHGNFKIITLPAGQNIYMLWKKLKEDDFETDIIEVLRENNKELEEQLEGISRDDFSEVYLFFDYDGHQDNLGQEDDIIEDIGKYKSISAMRSFYPQFKEYDYVIWRDLIDVFSMRVSCLMSQENVVSYEQYVESINPYEIYKLEKNEIQRNRVFILSAFPEFLLDYFGVKLWKTCVKHAMNLLGHKKCK